MRIPQVTYDELLGDRDAVPAHEHYLQFQTEKNYRSDQSAKGRLAIWAGGALPG
jgi:hypothetical protein